VTHFPSGLAEEWFHPCMMEYAYDSSKVAKEGLVFLIESFSGPQKLLNQIKSALYCID
jgi:hypothetical protein